MTIAKGSPPAPRKWKTTRSLRAKRCRIRSAVAGFTLKRSPGRWTRAARVPPTGRWTRW